MKNFENWKIRIVDTPCRITKDVYIIKEIFDGGLEVWKGDGLKNEIISKKDRFKEKQFEPTLSLLPEQLQVLADELNGMGIKPQKGFLEGKLQATESHLKDMRTLLKLK